MTLFVELIVYHNEHSRTIRNASVRNPTAMFLDMPGLHTKTQVTRHCHATTLPVAHWTGLLPGASNPPPEEKLGGYDYTKATEPLGWLGVTRESRVWAAGAEKMAMCCVKFARFVLLILLVSIIFSKADNLDKRKNVLVMIGDDVGFQSQVYNNTVCRTPNLNAFAKRSVTFRNGFTSVSSCSPSRSAILTGTKIGSGSYLWVR